MRTSIRMHILKQKQVYPRQQFRPPRSLFYFALFDAGNWLLRIIYKHIYHARKYKIPGNNRESFEEVITILYSLTQV